MYKKKFKQREFLTVEFIFAQVSSHVGYICPVCLYKFAYRHYAALRPPSMPSTSHHPMTESKEINYENHRLAALYSS